MKGEKKTKKRDGDQRKKRKNCGKSSRTVGDTTGLLGEDSTQRSNMEMKVKSSRM